MSDLLYRAALDVTETDGRTLIGTAYFFDRPALVRDVVGGVPTAPYLEAFAKNAAAKTLAERKDPWPLFANHQRGVNPLGPVRFEPFGDGMAFEAKLSATHASDEALALVNDGVMRSVSVGFESVKSGRVATPAGLVTMRQEIRLRELSLCATGFGQVPGAEVLAVRSDDDEEGGEEDGDEKVVERGTPRLIELRRRLIRLQLQ